ncbi:MAG: hypothetical protein V4598_12005 [Bdellovibrionota bacterium]
MIELKSIAEFIRTSPPLIQDGASLIMKNSLEAGELQDLIHGKHCAIHVPGYFSGHSAQIAAEKILSSSPSQTNFYDISYLMVNPKKLAMKEENSREEYYTGSFRKNRELNELFSPGPSPIDKLMIELDRVWNAGAQILKDEGRLNIAASVRYMSPETFIRGIPGGYKHIDAPLLPNQKVFSACLYLKVPSPGGNLKIWDIQRERNPGHPALKYCNSTEPEIQNALDEIFPEPLTLNVSAGDLVIFDTGRPHVVTPFETGERLCLQSFLIYRGPDLPLEFSA